MFSYNPLWKKLIDKGINKTNFANQCGLSKSTLSKMSKNQYVDMSTLNKICKFLNCEIEDIVKYIPDEE